MIYLRSLLYVLFFYPYTTLAVLGGVCVVPFGRSAVISYVRLWATGHGWLARVILGIRPVIEGRWPEGPVLVAAKHESAWETTALLAQLGDPMIVIKRELASIPLFGWLTQRHGAIPVDRSASASALRAMLLAVDAAKVEGRTVLIFPEGTRVEHGEAPKLQAGFAGIYARLGLPVVPVATDAGLAWPRGFLKPGGIVRLRIGEVIPPGLPRKQLEAEVHAAINALNG